MARRLLPLVLLALVGCGSASSARESGPRLQHRHACPGFSTFACSTLAVPLDHAGRRSGTLHLAVAAGTNTDASKGVLLLIAGGPGQPGVPLLPRISKILGAEQRRYRIVVYDQRGTGGGALNCPDLQSAMGTSDLFPPSVEAVRACAGQLGNRRQFFGTDDVLADMESLRRALGVERWTLDGVSYGSYVGERYALAHPDRVNKLVLDSVVPHRGQTDLGVVEFQATARVLRTVCGDGSCAADLAAVVRKLHDGPQLLDALTFDSIADPTYLTIFNVPTLLRDARRGKLAGLTQFLSIVRGYESAAAGVLDQGLHASALCADWRYPWGSSATPIAGREESVTRAVARLPMKALYPFDRATAANIGFVRQCLPWAPTPATPAAGGKITVPTLLVNGDRDLSTPLEWARQELKLTTQGELVVVPGAGHSTQSRAVSDVARAAVARFLSG